MRQPPACVEGRSGRHRCSSLCSWPDRALMPTTAVLTRHPCVGFPPFLYLLLFQVTSQTTCSQAPFSGSAPPKHPPSPQKPNHGKQRIRCQRSQSCWMWSPAPWEQVVVEGAFLCVQPSVSALAKKAYSVLETQLHSIPCPPGPSRALFPWSLGRQCFLPGPPPRELRE